MSEKVAMGQGALRLLCERRLAAAGHADHKRQVVKKAVKGVQSGVGTVSRTWETRGRSTLILPPSEIAVLWSLVAVGVTGILLGFRVRAPALIVMTAVIVVVGAIAGDTDGLFGRHRLLLILLLVVTLQCAYLIGLFLGLIWRRSVTRER